MILLVRFHAILILQIFPRAYTRSLIYNCSREHSFSNFCTRSLPILFIWPIDAIGANSSNSETVTSFACVLVLVNLPLRMGTVLFEFLPTIAWNIIYLAKWCYWSDFTQFWDSNFFRAHACAFEFVVALETTPFWIFAREQFQYYLFGLMMLQLRLRAILMLQLFSRKRKSLLIYGCYLEHSFLNFRVWSLPKLFILPNDVSGAISCNSKASTFFTRGLAHLNLPLLQEPSFCNFQVQSIPI